MGRKAQDTVDYFPHFAKQGKTLFILKTRWGNDGYAFWFQLLEVLCQEDGHYYDCSSDASWQFLLARTGVQETAAHEMLSLLAKLGNIDPECWERKVIWVPNLIANLSYAYSKRGRPLPSRPEITAGRISGTEMPISGTEIMGGGNSTPEKTPKNDQKTTENHGLQLDHNMISGTEMPISGTEMPISGTEMLQREGKGRERKEKKEKKRKEKKERKKEIHGEFKNVLFTDSEYRKLQERFRSDLPRLVELLSAGIEARGYKYKSHYAALLNWARREGGSQHGGQRDRTQARRLPKVYTPTPDYPELRGIDD